jgi:hypothetical protein
MVPPGANKSLKHIFNKSELKYSLAMMWVKNMTRTNRMWVQNMTGTNRMRVQNMTRTNYVLSKVCAFCIDKYGFPPSKALSIAMVPPGANKSLQHIFNKSELKYSLAMTKDSHYTISFVKKHVTLRFIWLVSKISHWYTV